MALLSPLAFSSVEGFGFPQPHYTLLTLAYCRTQAWPEANLEASGLRGRIQDGPREEKEVSPS